MRRRSFVISALALALVAGACSSSDSKSTTASQGAGGTTPATSGATGVVYPDADWEKVEPASLGMKAEPLAELTEFAKGKDSNCVAVIKDGKLVLDQNFRDFTPTSKQEVWSASKSVTSALVGIAQEQGKLTIDQPASTWLTEWKSTPSEPVTVKQLVSNDSGRYYDFDSDYVKMAIQAPDKNAYALGLSQQYPPATHWDYNNSAIQTLSPLLQRATGQDMEAFAKANLFDPIGMDVTIKRDEAGNPLAFMGVQANCHDMARFGWLYLNKGKWKDRQVVPEQWVADSTKPSQDLFPRYGYLWWLNGGGNDGKLSWDAAPADAYAALGLGEQIVLVIPSENLVAVRLGLPPGGALGQGNLVGEMARLVQEANGSASK